MKEIEYCYNEIKQLECVFGENLAKIDEKRAYQIGDDGIVFEVGTWGFQRKFLTYRMSLRQNQVIKKYFATNFRVI